MGILGEFLGIDTDSGLFHYFRRHDGDWFPALRRVHRTTFVRQANVHDLEAAEDMFDGVQGWALGDRNYWSPALQEKGLRQGLFWLTPYKSAKREKQIGRVG